MTLLLLEKGEKYHFLAKSNLQGLYGRFQRQNVANPKKAFSRKTTLKFEGSKLYRFNFIISSEIMFKIGQMKHNICIDIAIFTKEF